MKPTPPHRHLVRRRTFLQQTALASTAWALVGHSHAQGKAGSSLAQGSVILFQGDSITDAGRKKKAPEANDPAALGRGYPQMIGEGLLKDHPDKELQVFNRGISGHKVPQLDKRWQRDTIDLQPDLLSILIGVNDIWHTKAGKYDGTPAMYETGYRALLQRTRNALPECRIVVCEPFALKHGAVKDSWFPEFDEMRAISQKLAAENHCTFVPFQSMFDDAIRAENPGPYWVRDGVHPTPAGHALMAKTWREVVGV